MSTYYVDSTLQSIDGTSVLSLEYILSILYSHHMMISMIIKPTIDHIIRSKSVMYYELGHCTIVQNQNQ